MHALRITAAVIFVAFVPIFLTATTVRLVINLPSLYSYGFDKYNIVAYTGIERPELLSAARQLRDYFNNDEELLIIPLTVRGVQVNSLFNQREIIHMRDVKGLIHGVYLVQMLTALYLLGFAAAGIYLWRRSFWPMLARNASAGGFLTLGIIAFIGVVSLVGFDRLFLLFHLISFSNDFWQLDPSRDYLIAMFPQGFFFDATMLIAGSVILEAALLAAVPMALLKYLPQRRITRAQRRLAARTEAP